MAAYVRRTNDLALKIRTIKYETEVSMSITFEKPKLFEYLPGDWIDIGFDRRTDADIKTFSLSSSPTEANLMITFKIGFSSFKKRLQSLQVGDTVEIYQYGNSGFQLDTQKDAVMIAGGVGIAPFRSMLVQMHDYNITQTITLFYQSRTNDFVFRDELDKISASFPKFTIVYIDSVVRGRIKNTMILEHGIDIHNSAFYIAGPPAMVESTEKFLLSHDVSLIADDSFTGY